MTLKQTQAGLNIKGMRCTDSNGELEFKKKTSLANEAQLAGALSCVLGLGREGGIAGLMLRARA